MLWNRLSSKSQITFYGGVHEIGGNKFLVEDKGTKIFLDFGMQMGKVNQYYSESRPSTKVICVLLAAKLTLIVLCSIL